VASRKYFSAYGIKEPSTPLLTPEFRNPLFLKLFCQAVRRTDQREIPAGVSGITAVFDFVLDAIHGDLSRRLDYDHRENLVRRGIEALAERMVSTGRQVLGWQEVKEILDPLLPGRSFSQSLAHHFVSEGLLLVGPHWQLDGQWERKEAARFTYERLSDHLIVQSLLATESERANKELFAEDSRLAIFCAGPGQRKAPHGWVEALAIQLPETRGVELFDALPEMAREAQPRNAFLASLVWRRPESVTPGTRACINRYFPASWEEETDVLNAFLTVATREDHPFNADFLHGWLSKMRMPDRDVRWSVFLHLEHRRGRAVERLIDWAWTEKSQEPIKSEAIRLRPRGNQNAVYAGHC
jgi:hypothetical protein